MRRVLDSVGGPPSSREPLLSVLYVEDEMDNHRVAKLHLAGRCRLLTAINDEDACAILAREGPSLDAILMDIQLKGSTFDGMDLTRLVRGRLPPNTLPSWARQVPMLSTPVIFLTAYGERLAAGALEQTGGDWVLGKPVDFSRIDMALSTIRMEGTLRSLRDAKLKGSGS